jgi:hypothetical protein
MPTKEEVKENLELVKKEKFEEFMQEYKKKTNDERIEEHRNVFELIFGFGFEQGAVFGAEVALKLIKDDLKIKGLL